MEENNVSNVSKLAKRNIVLYISIAIILVSLTFNFSFAYFTASLQGEGEQNVITSGDIKVEFTDSEVFTATDMVILAPEEVEVQSEKSTFTVKNTGNLPANYKIVLNPTLSSNLISADFKWQLLSGGSVVSSGTFANAVSGQDMDLTSLTEILPDAQVSYEFRIWLAETNQNQIDLTKGTFTGIIKSVAISQ